MNEKNLDTMICSVCGEEKIISSFSYKYRVHEDIEPVCQRCLEVKRKEKLSVTNKERYVRQKELDPYTIWGRATINNHKRRGFQVDLTVEELVENARHSTHCNLCGCDLVWNGERVLSLIPTLDRINNENIMTKDNTQILCHRCNRMKGSMSMEEFVYYCNSIVNYKKGIITDTTILEELLKVRKIMTTREKEADAAIKRLHEQIDNVVRINREEIKR